MEIDRIRELSGTFLEGVDPAGLRLDLIEKGGSGRCFYRVGDPAGASWIAMVYSDDRPDNARFASITDFLIAHGIRVPAILGRVEDEGFLLVRDLGSVDLGDFAGSPWESDLKLRYAEALRTVFDLHQIREAKCPGDLPELEFCFDADLYRWEQDYFFNHYVRHFESAEAMDLRGHEDFARLREWLGGLPRSLVHRDFQSTNVMFCEGGCFLIDYQGMRFGLPEYDVASLVYDPYMALTPGQRDELIGYYLFLKRRAGHRESPEVFEERLDACAVQRLMQALGAYGFLGLEKGKKEFLQHIGPARDRLRLVAERAFPLLLEVLSQPAAGSGSLIS